MFTSLLHYFIQQMELKKNQKMMLFQSLIALVKQGGIY